MILEDLLSNPAVQGGVAPFLVGLVVALALRPARLHGLAVLAAFLTCVYLVSGLQFTPLTATRKVVLIGIGAALAGGLMSYCLRPTAYVTLALLAVCAALTLWVFWPVLATKPAPEMWRQGISAVLVVAVLVAVGYKLLQDDGVRVGAAALALGLGLGVAAIFSASARYGLYGISIGAGAGAFLLPQMIAGRKHAAGAIFPLTAMLLAGLVGAAAMILAELPWYALVALGFVPFATLLPAPAAVWLQALVWSIYAFVVAGAASALAWPTISQP